MNVILNRLKTVLKPSSSISPSFLFEDETGTLNPEWVVQHATINIQYSVLCSKIACEWSNDQSSEAFRVQMEEASRVAALLERIYCDYLDVPREVDRLKKERLFINRWLKKQKIIQNLNTNTFYVSKLIRDTTSDLNLPRLIGVRVKRLLMAIVPLTDKASAYHQTMQTIDGYASPIFSHLAWFMFIPRMTTHLMMIVKHTFEHDGMSQEEKALGWQTRLMIQLNARWPDISNDLPWIIANLMSCFVLVGPLLPYNLMLSIGMQFYEIVQSSLIYFSTINKLYQLRDEYSSAQTSQEHNQEITAYIEHLTKRINYDSKRLLIPIINTCVLLLAIILTAPIFAPGYAVAGGVLAVGTTFGALIAKNYVESGKPKSDLFDLLESEPQEQLMSL